MSNEQHAPAMCTTNGQSVADVRAGQTNETGQHAGYVLLCPDERAKGFVRPYRDSYRHVGERPTYPTRELAADDPLRKNYHYVAFEAFPDGSPESHGGTSSGRYWTAAQLQSGCGATTSMGRALSETWARDPNFYGLTFCACCDKHLPVSEFVWSGTSEVLGS